MPALVCSGNNRTQYESMATPLEGPGEEHLPGISQPLSPEDTGEGRVGQALRQDTVRFWQQVRESRTSGIPKLRRISMTRIPIRDLPHLEDLTPEQLKELYGAGAKAFKPSMETLEDRQLMSASGSLLAAQLPSLSAATLQQSAQVADSLYQPIQVISLDQTAQQTSPYTALVQNQTANPLVQQTVQQTDPIAAAQQSPLVELNRCAVVSVG